MAFSFDSIFTVASTSPLPVRIMRAAEACLACFGRCDDASLALLPTLCVTR
jgi:hypothetical protein